MVFRFEINEVFPMRKPVVALVGWLREGEVKINDLIAVSYTDGSTLVRPIVDIEARHKKTEYVNADGLEEQIGFAVHNLPITDIKIGSIAFDFQRLPPELVEGQVVERYDNTTFKIRLDDGRVFSHCILSGEELRQALLLKRGSRSSPCFLLHSLFYWKRDLAKLRPKVGQRVLVEVSLYNADIGMIRLNYQNPDA